MMLQAPPSLDHYGLGFHQELKVWPFKGKEGNMVATDAFKEIKRDMGPVGVIIVGLASEQGILPTPLPTPSQSTPLTMLHSVTSRADDDNDDTDDSEQKDGTMAQTTAVHT
jgi:hypothetical protein